MNCIFKKINENNDNVTQSGDKKRQSFKPFVTLYNFFSYVIFYFFFILFFFTLFFFFLFTRILFLFKKKKNDRVNK